MRQDSRNENKSISVQNSIDDAKRYDRQVRLWGEKAQRSLRASTVGVSGLSCTILEACKNLALAGCNLNIRGDCDNPNSQYVQFGSSDANDAYLKFEGNPLLCFGSSWERPRTSRRHPACPDLEDVAHFLQQLNSDVKVDYGIRTTLKPRSCMLFGLHSGNLWKVLQASEEHIVLVSETKNYVAILFDDKSISNRPEGYRSADGRYRLNFSTASQVPGVEYALRHLKYQAENVWVGKDEKTYCPVHVTSIMGSILSQELIKRLTGSADAKCNFFYMSASGNGEVYALDTRDLESDGTTKAQKHECIISHSSKLSSAETMALDDDADDLEVVSEEIALD